MEVQPRRLLYLLLGAASIFVIIWGIRGSAYIINPILMALVITITVLPIPGKLRQRGMPGWLALVRGVAGSRGCPRQAAPVLGQSDCLE